MNRLIPSEVIFHPVVNLFPPMSDLEIVELREDIEKYGLRECDAYDAKNRYGMPPSILLPDDPALGWKTINQAITA